jgi:Na+-driven multidrug efflux pump
MKGVSEMKKYLNLSFSYAMAAIVCGVFYREFTKAYAFTGRTTLAFMHLHLFALGTLLFLILGLYAEELDLEKQKSYRIFMRLYNIALPFMVIMFFIRGVAQVSGTALSAAADASVSGIAGISHTLLTIALILLFTSLKKASVRS